MDEQQNQEANQIQFLLSDFNTRLKDVEERNKLIKDRVLLLGKNLISSREELETEISNLKKQVNKIQKNLERLTSLVKDIIAETNKFARKDEMILIEQMLKDFQPLEFMRKKDVLELINKKLKKTKN